MSQVQHVASVHEKTVQRAQELADAASPARERGPQRRTVTHYVKMHPKVWKVALKIAGGDVTRLTIIDSKTVVVNNHSKRKTA